MMHRTNRGPAAHESRPHAGILATAVLGALLAPMAARAGTLCSTVADPDDPTPSSGTLSADAAGTSAMACGRSSSATGDYANAYGRSNNANGDFSAAFGNSNDANGAFSAAFGYSNATNGQMSSAFGYGNEANGQKSSAFGLGNDANGQWSNAFGSHSKASGLASSALGSYGQVLDNTADGSGSQYSIAIGGGDTATTGARIGTDDGAGAEAAIAIGHSVVVADGADNSVAIGTGASVLAGITDAVALGEGAVADRVGALSVGADGDERQVIHVADATGDTDAVNLRQLDALGLTLRGDAGGAYAVLAGYFGGGAGFDGTNFAAPVFTIGDTGFGDVTSAFAAVDLKLTDLQVQIDDIEQTPGPQGPAGPAGLQGAAGEDGEDAGRLVDSNGDGAPDRLVLGAGDDADGGSPDDAAAAANAGPIRLSNLAEGQSDDDAVNLAQMNAGDAATLANANARADAGDARTLASARDYTDSRFDALSSQWDGFRDDIWQRMDRTDRRIDRQGAMNAAMMQMGMNAGGARSPRGRVAVGVGFQGGQQALALGYAKPIGARASFSLGASFSGSEQSAGVGFGLDL